ncbi:MAG: hypothetical protein ABIU58_01105 [Ramlibacter sp.]
MEFLFVATQGANEQQAAQMVAQAVDLISQAHWMVMSIMGPLVMAVRGTPVDRPKTTGREDLVSRLSSTMGDRVKIIHGHGEAWVGDLGSPSRRAYGAPMQE